MDPHSTGEDLREPDRAYGAPRTYRRPVSPAAIMNEAQSRRTGASTRDASQLRRPAHFPVVSHGFIKLACPWTCYQKTYRLRFGVDFWLMSARQTTKPCDQVFVQELPNTMGKVDLQRFLELRHPNIHAVLDVFQKDKMRHAVFEYMEISLHEIANVGITTAELSTILKQLLDGVVYLSEQGVEHGSLTCSNVLVSREGTVKIGQCERCRPSTGREDTAGSCNLIAFQSIAAHLMGGHVKPRGAASLPDLERWHDAAAAFLADTTSATSLHELRSHAFFGLACVPEQLKSVVSRVVRMARIHVENVPFG